MRTWIEIRQERYAPGKDNRDNWSYGSALWSPTTNKAGSKIYELMKEPDVGERVLHFYETGGVRYYHAHSKIIESYKISYEIPTNPGSWSWAKSFYRIGIDEFKLIKNPIDINHFTEIHDIPLRQEILEDAPQNYPFQIKRYKDKKWEKDSQVTLKQGKYLQECTGKLFTLLQECTEIEISNQKEDKRNSQNEFAEGKRKERETYFFVRNPDLVKEAKRVHGYKCQACNFEFKNKYGDFGKNYIECHHENVLSERPEEEWNQFVKTSINDVKVLCSNCHRMVHHRRPALSFEELLELIKNE